MTLPNCLEPIKQIAFNRGWLLDKVAFGCALDTFDGHTRMVLAAHGGDGAYVLRRYHTEASDHAAAELSAGVRDALQKQNAEDARQREIAKRAGERRSHRRKGA